MLPTIEERGLTLVGVAVTNLESGAGAPAGQLPFDGSTTLSLDATVDTIRDRFGSASLTRAVLLGRNAGWSMPLLPD